MRARTAIGVFVTVVLGTAGLTSASSIGAATDGLTSDSMLAEARFGDAFSGRVPDDPDAPIRTGRWAEDTPAADVALAGGPPAATPEVETVAVQAKPSGSPLRLAAIDPDDVRLGPAGAIPLARVAWTAPRRAEAPALQPRFSLVVSEPAPGAPGSGLDVSTTVFEEPLAAARPARASPVAQAKRLVARLGAPPSVKSKGRWFVFAAGSGEAFGLNLIRDPIRGWKPAGWSLEQLAEFGKAQLGIGWRKGQRQVSLSAARREIGAYGVSREDTVVGVTFSMSGRPGPKPRYEQRLPKAR
ncbi:MAG: hypothetical protein ACOY4K_06815 [Pseudomonadota bacterium]